jgi:hypothetical protein
MFCNFCAKPVPQGEAYCKECAPKARSHRPKEEREAELADIKQGFRSKQKLSSQRRDEGKMELIRASLLMLLSWFLVHYCYIFRLGEGIGGEALVDLGILIFILFNVTSRRPFSRNLLVVRCFLFTGLAFYYAFSRLMEHPVSFSFFFIGGLLSLFSAAFVLLSKKVNNFFLYEE